MGKKKTIYRWGQNPAVGARFLRSPEVPLTSGTSGPWKFRPSSGHTESLHPLWSTPEAVEQGTEAPVPGSSGQPRSSEGRKFRSGSDEVLGYTGSLHKKRAVSLSGPKASQIRPGSSGPRKFRPSRKFRPEQKHLAVSFQIMGEVK